jgi:hypothetical protein
MAEDYLNSREAEDRALELLSERGQIGRDTPEAQVVATRALAWALVAVIRELRSGNRS